MKLSPSDIKTALPQAKPYRLADGRSLFVLIHPSGTKGFEFRYRRGGKLRAMIIGSTDTMGLKAARDERDRLRVMLKGGLDPIDQRRIDAEQQRAKIAELKATAVARKDAAKRGALTVNLVADAWVAETRAHWTQKHADQVEQSLRDHVYPDIGNKPVVAIAASDILDLLGNCLLRAGSKPLGACANDSTPSSSTRV